MTDSAKLQEKILLSAALPGSSTKIQLEQRATMQSSPKKYRNSE